ncbi:MAG: hypothetical protein WCG03_04285, partial [Kiritimatiellales bacterium]
MDSAHRVSGSNPWKKCANLPPDFQGLGKSPKEEPVNLLKREILISIMLIFAWLPFAEGSGFMR